MTRKVTACPHGSRARLDPAQWRVGRCPPQIMVSLEIHPELRRHPEVFAEAESHVCADSTPTSAKQRWSGTYFRPLALFQGRETPPRQKPHGWGT
jgi:hypothetical protein